MHSDNLSFELIPNKVLIKIYAKNFKPSTHYYIKGEVDELEVALNHNAITKDTNGLSLCVLRQVHGNEVVYVDQAWPQGQEPNADGMITDLSNVVLGIQTADCIPILISNHDGSYIGAIHCGWRSLYNGIIERCVDKLTHLSTQPLVAVMGPSITKKTYEVSEEYSNLWISVSKDYSKFFTPLGKASDKSQKSGFLCDLPGIAKLLLQKSKIKLVGHFEEDTVLNPSKYPSHRYACINNIGKYKGSILSTITKMNQ